MSFEIIHSPLIFSTFFVSCAKHHEAQSDTTRAINAPFTFIRISMTSIFHQAREKPTLVAVAGYRSRAAKLLEFLALNADRARQGLGCLAFPAASLTNDK